MKTVNFNVKNDYFDFVKKHPECMVIVYGAGKIAHEHYKYLGHIDYFCDLRARSIGKVENILCIAPEELQQFENKLIILICIKDETAVLEILNTLKNLNIDAEVFYYYNNPAFQRFDSSQYKHCADSRDKLKIRIVYVNDGWIFGKFAEKMQDELIKLGQDVDISDKEDPEADVNHYISYNRISHIYSNTNTVRTSMITHIDCVSKRDMIRFHAQNNVIGICMSADTMNRLAVWGIPRDKLCYVNPAQDGQIHPRKIVLGITNRCYSRIDFRKRDDLIVKVCECLSPDYFRLKIMGAGWNDIVREIRKMGFEVEYHDDFNREIYLEMMPSLDYWIYYGFDEGAMGFLDALAAGVETIATPQGFHLDVKHGLTYPCCTIEDFVEVLQKIQKKKDDIVGVVKNLTWENYAKKHLEIWQYLTHTKSLKDLCLHQGEYIDGIFSVLVSEIKCAY